MFPFIHYLRGLLKNAFNPRISIFAIISSTVTVDHTAYIYRGVKAKQASIGAHSYISANTDIENADIGKFCSIADHCRIGMSGHELGFLSTSPIFSQCENALQEKWIDRDILQSKEENERVIIGNDVWVGSHALIKGGVSIGDGAVIAAGAVVVKNVPPYAIVGGVPASIIRYRFEANIIDKLISVQWWNKNDEWLKKHIDIFQKKLSSSDILVPGLFD